MAGPVDPRLLTRARATRSYLVAGVVVGSATAILVVGQAWLLSRLVAAAFSAAGPTAPGKSAEFPLGGLMAGIGALSAVIVARAALAWSNSWLAHRAAAAVKSQLRSDIIRARLQQPGVHTLSTGQLVTLMTRGLDALDGYFGRYLPQLVLALTVPLVVGVAILTADLTSAVIVAITLPLIPLFMWLIGKATEAKINRSWRTQSRLANHFSDLVSGLPTLQVFGRAKSQVIGLEETESKHRSETMQTLGVTFLSSFVLELLATYSVALIAVPIGLRLVYGGFDLATGLFVLILAPEAYLPVRQVGVHYHDSVDGIAAADQAFAVIEAGETPDPRTKPRPLTSSLHVAFDDVTITYPGETTPALRGLDLTLSPGEIVGLTGPSGCGKSTALAGLMGFMPLSGGRITVGGVPFTELDVTEWRRTLAWVGQEPGMVHGSVADNLRLGDPDADEGALRAALDRAGAKGIPLTKQVGDDAEGLSAGERRRLAVARALLRIQAGARFLILDEPTAGLDAETETTVIEAVRASGAGALIVTHRPALQAACDRVVELVVTR